MWENLSAIRCCGKLKAMFTPKTRRMGKTSNGFTIVELLIVVVVIAILAAITIVAYNGITQRSKESAVKSAVSQAFKKIEVYKTLNGGALPADLAAAGVNAAGGSQYQYSLSDLGFCITATQSGVAAYTANGYAYGDSDTVNQATPVTGACPGHSTSGGTVVKNLATNSSFEVDTNGWTSATANIAVSTTWAHAGTRSLRVVNTGTGDAGDARISPASAAAMPFGMQPGKTYTISARLYFTNAPTGAFTRGPGILYWYSTNGSVWNPEFGPKAPTTPGTYTVSHTVTVPANATGVLIALGAASSTASQNFFYDSFMITEGSTVYTPADGTSPGWIWLGPAHTSPSTGPAL